MGNHQLKSKEKLNFRINSDLSDLKDLANKCQWELEIVEPSRIQINHPSKTIDRDILSNWNSLLENNFELLFDRFNPHKPPHQEYFYHLHCAIPYPIPETFICKISNAIVSKAQNQSDIYNLKVFEPGMKKKTDRLNLSGQKLGFYVSLLSAYTQNYAHWLMDSLPKLALLRSKLLTENLNYIIPKNPPHFIVNSLNLLGIKDEKVLHLDEEELILENLILCRPAQNSGRPSKIHLLDIRKLLLSSLRQRKKDSFSSSPRRIYISRANSARSIINEVEILPILKEYNFEVLLCENLSFTEQVKIFSEANVILGAHGAGIYNQIFCDSGATIIEIYNPKYCHHSSRIVAGFLEHHHWHIFGKHAGQDFQTWVDPRKLQQVLSLALA